MYGSEMAHCLFVDVSRSFSENLKFLWKNDVSGLKPQLNTTWNMNVLGTCERRRVRMLTGQEPERAVADT